MTQPDRVLFRRWLWSAVRPFLGWVLALLGAVALFLGWYGVSGTPVPAKQLPYLVSGGLTGVALVVLAAAFFATDDVRRRFADLERMERKVDALYELLTEDEPVVTTAAATALLALDSGTSYHLPDCRLVVGKAAAHALRSSDVTTRGLAPCRVCDPPRVLAV
jgi:hypothetical protein